MTQRDKQLELLFPVSGVVKRYGYQSQPPYTTPAAQNVRPFDVLDGRERGGTRPGIEKAFDENIGGGKRVQMLSPVAVVGSDAQVSYRLAAIADGTLWCSDANGDMQSVSGTMATSLNADAPVLAGAQHGSKFYIAEYRETPLGNTDGVLDSATKRLTAASVSNWNAQAVNVTLDMVMLSSIADGLWNGYAITAVTSGYLEIDWPDAYSTGSVTVKDSVVTLVGGTFPDWVEGVDIVIDGLGTFEIATLNSDTEVALVDLEVNSPNTYSTGTVTVAAGVVTLAGGGTWPAWVAGCKLYITNVGSYAISTRDSDTQVTLTNTGVTSATDNTFSVTQAATYSITPTVTNCTWQIYRAPRVYDPLAGTVTALAAEWGLVPIGCNLACTYRGRLVLAGPDHIWYMSAVDAPTDWDYGQDANNPDRAVAGTGSNSGDIGQPIKALIPCSDDYLLIGCENAIWIIKGDPGSSGQTYNLSREVGVIGPNAWCRLPDSTVVVVSRNGLYAIPPGGGYPQPFSENAIPEDLRDIDTELNLVSMCYDVQYSGLHLYITPLAGSAGQHWWIDWREKGFWPVAMPDALQPSTIVSAALEDGEPRYVLMGTVAGAITRYNADADDDDGTAITSWVRYGPLRLGDVAHDGIVAELTADIDESSDPVTADVYVADTPEGAVTSTTSAYTLTWTSGSNVTEHPRVRGTAACLEVGATSGQWAVERIGLTSRAGGRPR